MLLSTETEEQGTEMQKIAVIVIALIAALGLYKFLTPQSSQQSTAPVVDSKTAAAARDHINQLTHASASLAIPVNKADNFVTADQLLSLPGGQATRVVVSEQSATSSADASTYAVDLGLHGKPVVTGDKMSALPDATRLRLQELLNDPTKSKGRIFYIHSVDKLDKQGLWGIVQRGLTETFAKGIKVANQRVLSAKIPSDADERLQDDSSSFLGNLLDRKIKESLVYNYEEGLLGRDPNLIQPGQQLIIVQFSEDELIQIYNHFTHSQH